MLKGRFEGEGRGDSDEDVLSTSEELENVPSRAKDGGSIAAARIFESISAVLLVHVVGFVRKEIAYSPEC
jgi:hypothetical protein